MSNEINQRRIEQTSTIPETMQGKRLDQALSELWPDYSRMRIKQWLETGAILVNGKQKRPKDRVQGGEQAILDALLAPTIEWKAEKMPLNIIHADEAIIVINKPSNLVVHPADTTPDKTLVNGLLYQFPELAQLPRAGIVHRIDKDTTGLLVIARSPEAHKSLVEQIQQRQMGRHYHAIVYGTLTAGGTIDEPIGRDPHHRLKMAVTAKGKAAITHYRIAERFSGFTSLTITLETGRTHQIRVHMNHHKHPIMGDPLYGGRLRLPKAAQPALINFLQQFKRQALHAKTLHLIHPIKQQPLVFEAPIPEDMEQLTHLLRDYTHAQDQP